MGTAATENELLPVVETPLDAEGVLAALERLAKRGKLAGFRRIDGRTFAASAFGTPYDRELIGTCEPATARGTPHPGPLPGGEREGYVIRWRLVWKRKMPAIFAVVLIVSVWPGLPLTDSLLSTYWGWYEGVTGPDRRFRTWMWYLPLTVPTAPLVWLAGFKKSRAGTVQHAAETVEKVRGAVQA